MSDRQRQPEHRRGYYLVVLVVGVALSVVGNALHAWSAWQTAHPAGIGDGELGPVWSVLGTAIFPLILLMMTEMTMLAVTRFGGPVRWGLTVLAGCVAVISFAVSYEALVYTSRTVLGVGDDLSMVAPLVIDLPIIGATIALWAVADRIRQDATGADHAATMTPDHVSVGHSPDTPVLSGAGHPSDIAVQVSGERLDTPSTGAPDTPVQSVAGQSSDALLDEVSDEPRRTPDTGAEQLGQSLDTLVQVSSEPSSDTPDEVSIGQPDTAARPAAGHSLDTPDEVSIGQPDTPSTEASNTPVEGVRDLSDLAARVVEEVGTTAGAATVEQALRLHLDGAGLRRIGDEVGRSRSTVSPWIVTAKRLDPTYGRDEARALEVVR
ncbi:helix-turn-helix domain-containing protein [Gordonia sp. 852002-10350_SCH5691597]|uniref:helix-turn-helix domain-containing protein n=1 Tax=Gordonia sp. 852002-10350_SCH5691597 TaxID=1834085 RepID=UPI000ACC60E9|nr:helix-turn-helix domain-containing protein [Gordonia sp. 852002-10350_SCH5691597]